MRFSLMVAAILSIATHAHAQQPTREQTVAEVSKRLAEIQALYPPPSAIAQMNVVPTFEIQQRLDKALERATALRDWLRDNPYMRVTGFSVNIPWGMTVNVELKEGSGFVPAAK